MNEAISSGATLPDPQPIPLVPRRTLLVVDDEFGPRQSLQMVFRDDYNVVLADCGPRALELAREQRVDAAVLDIRMPGMSGVEVLAKLKELDPDVEIIMLTAFETIETARQALRLGACDYLTKPFELQAIRQSVARAMDRRAFSNQRRANIDRMRQLQGELQNQKLEEEIVRARGEIYASVLHDINGPLTIISGFAEIMNQHIRGAVLVEGDDLELIRDRLGRITRQVNNCIDVSQRYLGFLRRPSQAGVFVSATQVLHDVRELLQVHRSLQSHELVVRFPDPDVSVEINGAILIQMLLNLGVNALQCSPQPHQVELSVARVDPPLPPELFVDAIGTTLYNGSNLAPGRPLAAFTVRDTGPGIPQEILTAIFSPRRTFEADYVSTKEPGAGHGLGLAIVQRFVRDAHGALHVRTQPGQGTTFTVYLPAQQ